MTAESLSFIIVQDGNTADSVRFVNTTTVLPGPFSDLSVLTQPPQGHAHAQPASRLAHHRLPSRKALRRWTLTALHLSELSGKRCASRRLSGFVADPSTHSRPNNHLLHQPAEESMLPLFQDAEGWNHRVVILSKDNQIWRPKYEPNKPLATT